VTDEVEVWLDADFLERMRVGTLSHDRGTLRFAYDPVWLKNPQAFALDPDLSLGEGTYFPNAEAGFRRAVFIDPARPAAATFPRAELASELLSSRITRVDRKDRR
jgi:hypothetical protein